MNELLCPVACMGSCCCFSATGFNTARNAAQWTCMVWKELFPIFFLPKLHFSWSSAFPSVPHEHSWFIFGFVLFLFHCFFLSFSWAAEVPGIVHCPPKFLLVCLEWCMPFAFPCLRCAWSLLEPNPLTHHPSTCSHVSKFTEVVAVKQLFGQCSFCGKGKKYQFCSYLWGICEKTAREQQQQTQSVWQPGQAAAALGSFTSYLKMHYGWSTNVNTSPMRLKWDRTELALFLSSGFSALVPPLAEACQCKCGSAWLNGQLKWDKGLKTQLKEKKWGFLFGFWFFSKHFWWSS